MAPSSRLSWAPPTAVGIDIGHTASALSLGTHHVSVDAKDWLGNTAAQLNWVLTVTDILT